MAVTAIVIDYCRFLARGIDRACLDAPQARLRRKPAVEAVRAIEKYTGPSCQT